MSLPSDSSSAAIDPAFIAQLTDFELQVCRDPVHPPRISDLLGMLKRSFGCRAVAYFRTPSWPNHLRPGSLEILCSSSEDKDPKQIYQLLRHDPVWALVAQLRDREQRGSQGINIRDLPSEFAIITPPPPWFELEFIPLNDAEEGYFGNPPLQFVLLLDRNTPDPIRRVERRRQELAMVALVVEGWWVTHSAPIAKPSQYPLQPVEARLASRSFPDWLHAASLIELLGDGRSSAAWVRRKDSDNPTPYYFEGETDNPQMERFDWNKWHDRFFVSHEALKCWMKDGIVHAEKMPDVRVEELERGKHLVWWSRWYNSHMDLEADRISKTEVLAHDLEGSDFITVEKWVREQRIDSDRSKHEAAKLRSLAADALHGQADHGGLSINHPALLRFGLNRWLDENGTLLRSLESGALSDVEFCRTMHGIAVSAHHLLAGYPNSPDPDIIYRLVQLVSRYGHVELGIPSRIDLRAHLLLAARSEPALHALKHSYRDHFFHVLEVCFLGHVLLETKLTDGTYLWKLVAHEMDLGEDKKAVMRIWYMAALLHDVGYAMDVLESSYKHLGFFRHSQSLQGLSEQFKKAIADLAELPEVKQFCDQNDDIAKCLTEIERDHGYVGALHVYTLLKNINETDPGVRPKEYKSVIRAIALHNLHRHTAKIAFSRDPLAFLLALCDQLQEWRRPRLPYAISPNVLLARMRGGMQGIKTSEDAVKEMTVNLDVEATELGEIAFTLQELGSGLPTLRFTIEYDKTINKLSGVFYVWLDATLNFQRLDFDTLPLDIQVIYKTPMFVPVNSRSGGAQPQMHRLRDAAHETHMGFLANWFPNEKHGDALTNGAVTYRCDEEAGMEVLTLDLRQLSSQVRMTQSMKKFKKRLESWKHYIDEQEFPGDYAVTIPE